MLSRSQRLSTTQFNVVMEKGKIVHSPLFLARVLSGQVDTRIAAVAPVKIIKTAVGRNKIRRKTYEAVGTIINSRPSSSAPIGAHIIIFVKPTIVKATQAEIITDLKSLFVKAGILR